jgi:hypothetical protein
MKNKRIAQSDFFHLCFLLGLITFFAGVLFVEFAAANPKISTPERTPHIGAQEYRVEGAPVAPSDGVYEAWVARYNGPGNGFDYALALAVDAQGNVYVTGYSWGSGTQDYATIKYDPSGNQEWVARYDGRGRDDQANALAVDDSGNVYVTGFSGSIHTQFDCATIKYNSVGQQVWVARLTAPAPPGSYSNVSGKVIALDHSGNVYVAGVISVSGTRTWWVTAKYNASGEQQWVTEYFGVTGLNEPTAMAVDDSGNIYVTGSSSRPPIGTDYTTIKYDAAGQEQWVARDQGNSFDSANAIAIDVSGNVYVTGTYATIKYNSAGQQQWVTPYPSGVAYAIAIDDSGNVYVTGQAVKGEGYPDYGTIKYDASGEQQWIAYYNGPGNGNEIPKSIALDGEGNVYVTGISHRTSPFSDYDYATIKYNSAGQEQWVDRYNGPGNAYEQVSGLAVGASGNVYVTGRSGSGFDDDYVTIKYGQGSSPTPTPTPTPNSTPSSTPRASPMPRPRPTPRPRP